MDFEDYIKFANNVRRGFFATVEEDQPRVRTFGMCFADETGFYFQTEAMKSVAKQLKKNGKVEVLFWQPGSGGGLGRQMRVSGEIEFVDDLTIRTKIFEERAALLKGIGIAKPQDPDLVIFRIAKGEAFFWTMENNTRESEIERVKFGVQK
jgi:uncharacterized pyridoxamine 5'-phosphate oxidase family protein